MNELIELIPSIILAAILTPLVVFPFAIAKRFVTHSKQRQDLANSFSENTGHRYRGFLGNTLNKLDSIIGKPFSFKSFKFSLQIAFFYPVIVNVLMWLIGNYPYQLAGTTIFPTISATNRLIITISILLFLAISFLWIRSSKKIDLWFEQITLKRRLLISVLFGAIILFILVNAGLPATLAVVLASYFAISFAITFFPFSSVVGGGVFLFFGTVALAGLGTSTGIFALTGAVFLVFAFVFTGGFASAVFFAFVGACGITLIDIINSGVISSVTASWLFFLFLLPFTNALLDFISTSFSRLFSRLLTEKRDNWVVVTLWLLFDLALAFWFLIGLVIVLVFTLESLNQLLPSIETLFPWQSYVEQVKSQPLGAGFFVVFMLYSTLIPTVLHIGLGLYSLLLGLTQEAP